jgi:hypothetical protein
VADDSGSAQASTPEHLSWFERVVALLIGAGILIWSAVLLFSPPEHKEVISGCKATATKDCVQTVSSIPETVTTALVGVGGVLLLIALLGIRFSSIKAPGGFELGTSTTETSKDEADDAADKGKANPVVPPPTAEMFRASTVSEETTAAQLRAWSLLPPNVREAAVRRWASSGKTGDPSTQVAQIYAPAANNNDWYIVFVDDTTFRITVATT